MPKKPRQNNPKAAESPGETPPRESRRNSTRGLGLFVVGVGASAGGLEGFSDLLRHIPENIGTAFVLVQHLDPVHASSLPELLSRATTLRVTEATDRIAVEPDRVYVIPPNSLMRLERGALRLEPRAQQTHHMPVDYFFSSLAVEQGSRAIGVVLSGTASDGTLGLKDIKAAGGITFAQDSTARYDGMPRSAIAAGYVDFVLPPAGIAREIARLCSHPYMRIASEKEMPDKGGPDTDQQFAEIYTMLRNATGVDFTCYKHGTIRRRIQRRMALHKLDKAEQYVRLVRDNREELQSLFQDILINVTAFFREPEAFDALEARVFPALVQDRQQDNPIRIWIPGCSTGEEAYSVAMALLEFMRARDLDFPVQIFGTDLSEVALAKARAGIFTESAVADIEPGRLRRFFSKVDGNYQISRSVRDLCVFARQNITKDPPFSRIDLISCRNVLIYLGPVLQSRVLRTFHYALKPGGFLVLGQSEAVGTASEMFDPLDRKHRIYVRKPGAPVVAMDISPHDERVLQAAARRVQEFEGSLAVQHKADQVILSRYAPPGVIVDKNLHIIQFRGETSPFLQHMPGDASLSLLKMARGGLGLELRKLIPAAWKKNSTVRSDVLHFAEGKTVRRLNVTVVPLRAGTETAESALVLFEELPSSDTAPVRAGKQPPKTSPVTARRVQELEEELTATKQYLQSVIEEQEATTEELKSANEEIQSSDEELQSTNEELLTAKEELQSTNEELTTLNEEMQSRNAELMQINNDLQNLLSSTNIPIVMVGNDLRIRRFTPQAERVLNLLPGDVGRPISDFKPKIDVPDLEQLFLEVVENLAVKERDVQDREGRHYSMWVRPYRTAENRIEGAVMSLTERKQTADGRYRRLFESTHDGILLLNESGEIIDVNPYVSERFGYSRDELLDRKVHELELFQNTSLENRLAAVKGNHVLRRTVWLTVRGGETVEVEVVANRYSEGSQDVVQLNVRDITVRRRTESSRPAPGDGGGPESMVRLSAGLARQFENLAADITRQHHMLTERLPAGDPLQEETRRTGERLERAATLARQILSFTQDGPRSPALLDFTRVVRQMEPIFSLLLDEAVQVEVSPSTRGRVNADRGHIEQLVLALVLHARNTMPDGAGVKVTVSDEDIDEEFAREHPAVSAGSYVCLAVADAGDAETRTRTESFQALPPVPPVGLASVLDAIRRCGGHLWAYSEIARGTVFKVYLPRAGEKAGAGEAS